MNEKLKKIHLISGLSLLAFMLMYFVSGFIFYNDWLVPNSQPERTVENVELDMPSGLSDEEMGSWLAAELNIEGQLRNSWPQDDGGRRMVWSIPGKGTVVVLAGDYRSAEVTTAVKGIEGTSVDYHFVHGYGHGLLYNLWALMLDLAAAGCLVFAFSGIGIWVTARERDRVSWVMLIAGLGITAWMIFYYMVLM
jgi:hypothetical protein